MGKGCHKTGSRSPATKIATRQSRNNRRPFFSIENFRDKANIKVNLVNMPVNVKVEEPEPMSSSPVRSAVISDSAPRTGDGNVVREIDVYLSNELAESLKLIQYPLQQAGTSQMPISSARLKPRHHILQIDQDMPSLPRRIYSPQEQNFSFMTTRTFQSQTIPVETHLCVGKMNKGENGESAIYLVPVQHISQMRPTMSHIHGDTIPEEGKGEDDAMEEEKETKGSLKPLAFQRKESERAAELRKSSYNYKKKSEASEEWEQLEVVPDDSDQIDSILKKLFNAESDVKPMKTETSKPTRSTRPHVDYVESLNYMPPSSYDSLAVQVHPDDPKTIVARLTILLRQGLPIPYSLLRAQLPAELTDEKVFDALAVCAIMVRGNFCLHSRFVSLPRELQRTRTFMLSLLQNNGLIRRNCLEKVYKSDSRVSSEKLHILLRLIAKRTTKGWILRVDDDLAFVADYPDQAARYQQYWDKVFETSKQKELLRRYNEALISTSS